MEDVSYYFNGDLEKFLSSKQSKYKINFNKFNQEFEFLVSILENSLICSNREYSDKYRAHLSKIFDINLMTTLDKVNARLWCCDLYDLSFQTKINSRFFTQKIANDFNDFQTEEISSMSEVEEGFVYKENISVSGSGNYLFPKDKLKIKKKLNRENLLKDKFYERELDISTLIDGNNIYHYKNIVDEYFQYKGTVVGEDLSNYSWYNSYKEKVETFLNYKMPIQGVYSIDSFISNSEVVFMSEINNRKTMGYIAHKMKGKYYSEYSLFKTLLISNKRIKNKTYDLNLEGVVLISPENNIFGFYILFGQSAEDLKDKELRLYNKIFD